MPTAAGLVPARQDSSGQARRPPPSTRQAQPRSRLLQPCGTPGAACPSSPAKRAANSCRAAVCTQLQSNAYRTSLPCFTPAASTGAGHAAGAGGRPGPRRPPAKPRPAAPRGRSAWGSRRARCARSPSRRSSAAGAGRAPRQSSRPPARCWALCTAQSAAPSCAVAPLISAMRRAAVTPTTCQLSQRPPQPPCS